MRTVKPVQWEMEQPFLESIAADPDNPDPRGIYTDWLEEQGDLRASFVHKVAEYCSLPDDAPKRLLRRRIQHVRARLNHKWLEVTGYWTAEALQKIPPLGRDSPVTLKSYWRTVESSRNIEDPALAIRVTQADERPYITFHCGSVVDLATEEDFVLDIDRSRIVIHPRHAWFIDGAALYYGDGTEFEAEDSDSGVGLRQDRSARMPVLDRRYYRTDSVVASAVRPVTLNETLRNDWLDGLSAEVCYDLYALPGPPDGLAVPYVILDGSQHASESSTSHTVGEDTDEEVEDVPPIDMSECSTEDDFLEIIRANPSNVVPKLAYADWLEERDDPRSTLIREATEFWAGTSTECAARLKQIREMVSNCKQSWLETLGYQRFATMSLPHEALDQAFQEAERPFLDAIRGTLPAARAVRLEYANWLEKQGDPRAKLLRCMAIEWSGYLATPDTIDVLRDFAAMARECHGTWIRDMCYSGAYEYLKMCRFRDLPEL